MVKTLSLALLATTVLSTSALAVPANVPSVVDSGRLQEKLSDKKPELKIEKDVLIKDEAAPQNANAANISFTLDSVIIEGNTVFKTSELEQFYKSKIGQKVTLAEMYEVRDQITKYYREKGYVLSRAVVPAQRLGKGKANFKIRIIEGYLNNVTTEGEFKGDRKILDNYISKIKSSGPLNSGNLERYLLLLNDLPGVTANAVLKPASGAGKTGASDLVIKLDHDYVSGVVSLDNSGTKYIGRDLITGEAKLNSALGLSEEIRARGIVSGNINELRFGDLSYKMPIGYEGTAVRVGFGHTNTKPGSTLKSLGLEGDTLVYDLEVTHPFLRSRKENFSGRVGLSVKNSKTDSFGVETYDDRTRELTLGGTYDLADKYSGVNLIDFSVTKGLDIFDASGDANPPSRANGENDFLKLNFEANRLQQISGPFGILFAASGQYSFDPLLAVDEFGVGGTEYGSGYDFSEITGDHGLDGKVELQYGFDFDNEWLNSTQIYAFYDIGAVWQKDKLPGEDSRESLASTGIGSRFNLFNTAAGYVELAKPLTHEVVSEGDKDVQFNFGLSYLF